MESGHYIIDWNYDEDRSQIRTGFGPEYITRLRRFAVGILKFFQKPAQSIPEMMRKLTFRTRPFERCTPGNYNPQGSYAQYMRNMRRAAAGELRAPGNDAVAAACS